MKALAALAFCFASGAALAQEVGECDWRAAAAAIAEPWEENTRTFANGTVRLALLDTIEPANGSFHLLILSPPLGETGERQCRVISREGGEGWAGLMFAQLEAGYDPERGLIFSLPGMIYLPEKTFSNSTLLTVVLNQSTGEITVSQKLGRE